MDKQITQLIELDQFVGDEYVVVASEKYADNYKVKAKDLVGEFVDEFITVDDHLSETSINPVQNRVITAELKKIDERLDNLDGGNNGEGGNDNPGTGGGSGSGSGSGSSNYNFNLAVASVETETLEPGKSANVRITDLGVDNTNTKNLAFKFSIPRGADGKGGSGDADDNGGESFGYRTVFAFKSSKTKPAKPVGGHWDVTTNIVTYPTGWSPGDDLERPVWMSNATFDYKGIVQDWTDPFEVSGSDGEGGSEQPNDGADSKAKEFIYKQTVKEETPEVPSNNKAQDDYVPSAEGWNDHPNGVSEKILCEWVCTRDWDKTQLQWSDWNGPVLWSKYGVNGKDGDGVEYIYQRTSTNTRPTTPGTEPAEHSPVTDFQEREFIPKKADSDENEWTDNPLDVTADLPYEWVSIRKFNWSDQQWGLFQEPTIWAKYGKDGGEGIATFKSLVFCRTNKTPIAPEANQDGGSYSNPVPTSAVRVTDSEGNITVINTYWEDGIPTGTEQIWMTSRIFSADGKLPQQDHWTTPQAMSDTADFEVMYSPNIERVNLPDGFKKNGTDIDPTWEYNANQTGWYDDANEWGSSPTVWMATNQAKNGIWQGWQIFKVLGEKGADGTSINILGSFDSYEALEQARLNSTLPGNNPPLVGDSYLVNGDIYIWDGDSWVNGGNIKGAPGKGIVATNYRYAISQHNVYNSSYPITGEWLAYSPSTDPINKYLWKETVIKYGYVDDDATDDITYYEIIGTHGDRGIDGDTTEYIYILTKDNYSVPKLPTSSDSIDTNIKGNWTDDPQDVNITYPYQWISERTRSYDDTTNKMVWSAYSTPAIWNTYAEDGRGIQKVNTQYNASKLNAGVDGSTSSNNLYGSWTETSPATTATYPFLWKRTQIVFTDNTSTDWTYEMIGALGDPGIDGISVQYAYLLTEAKTSIPTAPSGDVEGKETPGEWSDDPLYLGVYNEGTSSEITYKFQWVSERTGSNGNWSDWSTPTIWSELYPGTYLHIKYSNDMENFTTNNDVGKYIGTLVDYNEGDSGEFDDYTWRKFQGDDGFGREYIFQLGGEDAPYIGNLTSENWEQYVPYGWSPDPLSPTADKPRCWACHRNYRNGEWYAWAGNSTTNYEYAYLFSMYAESIPGETGSQGPIVYPAGYFEPNKTYTQDIVNGVVRATPYVIDTTNKTIYILNTSSYTSSAYPSKDSTGSWIEAEMFEAIYTDILLANNALVGSAVFNGDYMFSQNGNGQYKDFDGSKIYKEGSPFDPAWCVNLVTGEQWSGTGAVYFAADGSGYLANKKISWGADGTLKLPASGYVSATYKEHSLTRGELIVNFNISSGTILGETSHVRIIGSNDGINAVRILDQGKLTMPAGKTISFGDVGYTYVLLEVDGEIIAKCESQLSDIKKKTFTVNDDTSDGGIDIVSVAANRYEAGYPTVTFVGDSATVAVLVENTHPFNDVTFNIRLSNCTYNDSQSSISLKLNAGESKLFAFTTLSTVNESSITISQTA